MRLRQGGPPRSYQRQRCPTGRQMDALFGIVPLHGGLTARQTERPLMKKLISGLALAAALVLGSATMASAAPGGAPAAHWSAILRRPTRLPLQHTPPGSRRRGRSRVLRRSDFGIQGPRARSARGPCVSTTWSPQRREESRGLPSRGRALRVRIDAAVARPPLPVESQPGNCPPEWAFEENVDQGERQSPTERKENQHQPLSRRRSALASAPA
jgi:hypothetical protein